MTKKRSKLIPLLFFFCFGSAFMIAGLGTAYFGAIKYYEAMASLSWQTCEGTITHSEVESRTVRKGRRTHRESIRYDYTVGGEKYTGDRYCLWTFWRSDSRRASEIVDAHPVGAVVKVYYSPNSPAESMLMPGAHFDVYLLFGFGVVFFMVGAGITYASVRSVVWG